MQWWQLIFAVDTNQNMGILVWINWRVPTRSCQNNDQHVLAPDGESHPVRLPERLSLSLFILDPFKAYS